jgi:plasmid stabilization system protein ParE
MLDLAEELSWLNEKAGPEVAQSWYEALESTIRQLEEHPHLGRERKDLSPKGVRSWRVAGFTRWLVFYGVDEQNNIVMYRVRQGMMNLTVLKM